MPSILILLRLAGGIAEQYYEGVRTAFPDMDVNFIDHVDKADRYLSEVEILITHGPYLADRADFVFANSPNLKWVQGIGTGVDNIIDRPALQKNVIVTNIHGVHGPQMSEAALAAMLVLSRRIQRSVKNQQQHRWENWPSRLLNGKTLGIFGVGSIAESIAPRCRALGMKVIGISSGVRSVEGFDHIYDRSQLSEVVPQLDYFLLLTPLSPATRGIIDARILGLMKPDSYLINLARGGVVDEQALVETMQQQRIAGAAIDVFATEPLPEDHIFWTLENVFITCHQGASHDASARQILPTIVENVRRFRKGDFVDMINLVRPAAAPGQMAITQA
jgi:phosphoglycerate dehydrogenase-like enzyme